MSKIKMCMCVLLLLGIGALGYYLGYDAHKTSGQMSSDEFHATFMPVSPEEEGKLKTSEKYISISVDEGKFVIYRIDDEAVLSEGKCDVEGNIAILKDLDGSISSVVFTDDKWYWTDSKKGISEVVRVSPGPTLPKGYDF